MVVSTALVLNLQALTSSESYSLQTSMSESQTARDYMMQKALVRPKFNIPLKLVIAKTVSVKDLKDTISDIQALKERYSHYYQIQWKLFCYNNETYESLLEIFDEDSWKQDYNTEIYLWPGKNKINFWYKYLNPELIPSDIDYIWMMDGDIRLRNMAWDCFWNFVAAFKPAIFAPTLMSNPDPKSELRKHFTGSTHPQNCHIDYSMGKDNDIQHLIAMDTWVVEIQLPILTRSAWQVVYEEFSRKLPDWGDFPSMWGPDLIWCKLVDHHLLKVNNTETDRLEGRPKMEWARAKSTCSLDKNIKHLTDEGRNHFYYDAYVGKQFPHACMLIQATPAEHLDSKSIDKHKQQTSSSQFSSLGYKAMDKYKNAFPQFFAAKSDAERSLYRAYLSDDKAEYQCQECKHVGCMG
jgi:hypothetical protein